MKFELNKPFETERPQVPVDAPSRPGQYRFQLVVENQRGQRSRPAVAVVTVEPRQPTPR